MTIEVSHRGFAGTGELIETGTAAISAEYGCVKLRFNEPRGFGLSVFTSTIGTDSFTKVARAMLHANPEEAIKAFGAALQEGIPEKRDRWTP